MKFRPLAVTAAVAALLLAGAGVALAQDATTGPDTVACTDATSAEAAALAARDAAKVPSDVEQKVTQAQAALDAGVVLVTNVKADLNEAQAFLDGLGVNPPPSTVTYFQGQVNTLTASLATATAAQVQLTTARDTAAADLKTAQDGLGAAQAKLDEATAARKAACAVPEVPATNTAAPTTTPAPGPLYATCAEASDAGVYDIPAGAPGYRPELDSDGDQVACERPSVLPGDYSQVGTVPVGSVDTGA